MVVRKKKGIRTWLLVGGRREEGPSPARYPGGEEERIGSWARKDDCRGLGSAILELRGGERKRKGRDDFQCR